MKTKLTKQTDDDVIAEASDKAFERQEAKTRLYAEQAALTLQILQELAHDVWGSADLHFDGDCFGEFEWCVVMRGGGFDMSRDIAQGKTALEAVLAGITVKLRGCRGEYKKRLKRLQKYYGQRSQEISDKLKALG